MRKVALTALAAILALGLAATSASSAKAAEGTFVVSAGTTSYTATQGLSMAISLPGGRVLTCESVSWTGSISNGAKTLTATPSLSKCVAKVGGTTLPATVTTTGCTFKFSDLTSTEPGFWWAFAEIQCELGKDWQIKLYANAANHTAGTRLCEYTIQSQSLGGNTTFTDNADGTVTVNSLGSSLFIDRVFGTIANCGAASGFALYESGTMRATAASGTIDID